MSRSRAVRYRSFRYLVLLIAVVTVLAGSAFTGGIAVHAQGSSTIPACGIGLRLLVVSADGTEVALPAIESSLRYLGTPYTLHIATQNPNGLTPESLMDGCKARYNGIILTTASLAYTPDGGTHVDERADSGRVSGARVVRTNERCAAGDVVHVPDAGSRVRVGPWR